QHSQSLEAWFAHVPGLKVVTPATVQDAHDLLLASVLDPNPVIHLEHKLLYKTEGPLEPRARIADTPARIGEAAVLREGSDLTIAAYSIMAIRALEAANALADEGIEAEVIDMRTVKPLDMATVRTSVKRTGRLLVSHEAPGPVGVGAEIVAGVVESDALDYLLAPVRRVCGMDVPMPYAKELERTVIPQTEDVVDAARELMKS
ncbi:MAG: alpha-ketoacid dehydrogenase subunit beta, partial [Acidimicrobiia bacterium]